MQRGFFVFLMLGIITTGVNAASTRGVTTASRNGITTAATQTINPASGYTYNYMYPYLNNDMRTTLNPGVTTSQSTSPINAIVRTEQLSPPRRVVARPTPQNSTTTTTNPVNSNSVRAATGTGTTPMTQRRVVARPNSPTQQNTRSATNTTVARNVSRAQRETGTENTGTVATSARCLADYTACMNQYCERVDTTYNRCYCSAKLAQIDAEYQPQIDSLVRQIIGIKYGNTPTDDDELRDFWATTVGKYTGDDSWTKIDDALNIDWASMESRVRGQNAFKTGHEYCMQHIAGCFYMASNLRDAYRSKISRDCDTYEKALINVENAAESLIEYYSE